MKKKFITRGKYGTFLSLLVSSTLILGCTKSEKTSFDIKKVCVGHTCSLGVTPLDKTYLQGLVKDQLVSTVPYIKNDIKNSNLTWVGLRKYAGKYITDNKVLEAMHIPQCGDKDCNINSDPTAYIFPENIKTANVEVKGTIDIKNKTFDVDSFVDITFKNDLSAPTITDTCTGLTCDFKVSNIAAYKSTPVDLYWMSDNKTLGKSKSTSGNGSFSYTFTSDKTPVSITAYAETSDNNRSVDSNKLSVFAPEVTVTATASQSTVEEGKTITLTANATLPDGVTVKSYSWALQVVGKYLQVV